MIDLKTTEHPTIGIVGCGLIADTHVEAVLAAVPNASIHVVDPLPGKAELLRRKYNLTASYQEISRMLAKAQPFSVHVLSPPRWHVAHARECLEAGANVLVEKPLCFSTRDARELYDLARSRGLIVCVDHSLLFQPTVLRMRRLLDSSDTLSLLHFDSFYGLDTDEVSGPDLPAAHWKRAIPGGTLMDSLVHPVSLAVALTGCPCGLTASMLDVRGQQQMKVMWRAKDALISVTVSQGAQPFRRTTSVVTTGLSCTVDHSSEVLVVQGKGFGPRAVKKLLGNIGLAVQLASGTVHTAWKVARRKLQQNPGARTLIGAYYRHLAADAENPVPEESVLNTTVALEQTATLIESAFSPRPSAPEVQSQPAAASSGAPQRRILVTGASGFLGRSLCERLVASDDYCVIAQVRRGANADKLCVQPVLEKRYLDFDHFTEVDFRYLVDGVDDIVHCAHAAGSRTWRDYERRNVEHSIALYEAAAAVGCKRFIHVSSLAVYGVGCRGKIPLDEDVPTTNGAKWDFYIRSKKITEEVLLARAAKGGPQLLILRPGILYSPAGERLFSKSLPTRNGRLFLLIGSGRNHLPYTRVDVVADLIARCLGTTPFPTGVFNLCGDQKESVEEFLSRRCEALGLECKFMRLPAFPLRAAALVLEALHSVTRRKRPPKVTRYIVNSATRNLAYDCTRAREALGWDSGLAVAP